MITDEELGAIRERAATSPIVAQSANDRIKLLAEVDRLREIERLARKWLAAFHRCGADNGPNLDEEDAREALRLTLEGKG